MEIQNVFYRLWSKEEFSSKIEEARYYVDYVDSCPENVDKVFFRINENNRAFLCELKRYIKHHGNSEMLSWLGFLMDDYVRRSGGSVISVGNFNGIDCSSYNLWITNTRYICRDNILIMDWCREQEGIIRDFSTERVKSMQESPTNKRKKKAPSFRDIIQYSDKDKLLVRLHELIDGKGGEAVGHVLVRAKKIDGYLTRYPTQKEYVSEFKLVRSWQGITNYFYKEDDNDVLAKASNIVIFD